MLSVLARHYPSFRMDEVCRHCRGNAKKNLQVLRCGVCKMTHQDYKDRNLEAEIEEWNYLHQTWLKCRLYKTVTTGVSTLDNVLERLFGKPHDRDWRNYEKEKAREIRLLRTARV